MTSRISNVSRTIAKAIVGAVKDAAPAAVPAPIAPPEIKIVKPVQQAQHRVIAGMGSGGPEDVNTYAMFDRLPRAQQDAIRAKTDRHNFGLARGGEDAIKQPEGTGVDIVADAIADIMDRAYARDPKDQKLKPKADLPLEADVDQAMQDKTP